jgi:hypothetical protein
MFLTTLKSQTKKRKAIAAGCVRCLFGGTCACQDEKINSIDKKEKEKRAKKKRLELVIVLFYKNKDATQVEFS